MLPERVLAIVFLLLSWLVLKFHPSTDSEHWVMSTGLRFSHQNNRQDGKSIMVKARW
jgi:hypothetical protein